ncbi:MAG: thioredoxin family protein [Campylobacterota bacterium]
MKHFILITLFISSLFSANIDWLHDYNKALSLAKAQNKDVYLFVGADECRWCDVFIKMTLSKKEVIQKLEEDYILLYMSRDKHDIPEKFERYGVPRHYFLTYTGKIIHSDRGSREPAGFYDILDEVDLKKD